ncbi:hypothetical protein [Frankia sp. Cr1]|uniref:hypothetical protein n=1 Tax=Frankia sp. Cr1 TaxID=3073931 RepID=UPI002AD5778B|nr:hypothetical protein [Frankia sp. Cr1]
MKHRLPARQWFALFVRPIWLYLDKPQLHVETQPSESRSSFAATAPAEGQQVDRILAALAGVGHDMSEVMVIAPFRDIARNVAPHVRRYPGQAADLRPRGPPAARIPHIGFLWCDGSG